MGEEITRPTYMEIDLNAFKHNISEIKKIIGDSADIMPVIKANAYGTYINTRPDILNDFNIVAVATVDEAVEIRKIGYQKEIFVLNQPAICEIQKIIDYDIIVGISSIDFAYELSKQPHIIRVHVEFGTGMGRTGIHPDRAEEYITNLSKNIIVEGVYTHFSSADSDDDFTKKQLKSFNKAVEVCKRLLPNLKYIHAAASNAILNYSESHFNLVRPGIIMYGYSSSKDTLNKIDIKPIAKLKSHITFLKDVPEGTSIGYNRSFITTKETKVATVPIGYADGFRRTFSNGWEVLIRGKKAPIIGKICMDSFMCDVSNIEGVSIGDEVIIWDNKNIKLEDLAQKCDTINYEILSCISSRVPRKMTLI